MRRLLVLASLLAAVGMSHGCAEAEAFTPPATATVNCYVGTNGAAAVLQTGYPVVGYLQIKEGVWNVYASSTLTGAVIVSTGPCSAT